MIKKVARRNFDGRRLGNFFGYTMTNLYLTLTFKVKSIFLFRILYFWIRKSKKRKSFYFEHEPDDDLTEKLWRAEWPCCQPWSWRSLQGQVEFSIDNPWILLFFDFSGKKCRVRLRKMYSNSKTPSRARLKTRSPLSNTSEILQLCHFEHP